MNHSLTEGVREFVAYREAIASKNQVDIKNFDLSLGMLEWWVGMVDPLVHSTLPSPLVEYDSNC